MALNKFYNLEINSDVKSSRFVVDLKQNLLEKEAQQPKIKKSQNIEEKFEKFAEIDYRGILKKGKDKSGVYLTNIVKALKPEIAAPAKFFLRSGLAWPLNASNNDKKNKKPEIASSLNAPRNDKLSNQLTLVVLSKLLYVVLKKFFILFYKICYAIGWAIAFIFILAYFFILAVFSPFIKIIKLVFLKFKNILPAGFKTARSFLSMALAKLFRPLQLLKTAKKKKQKKSYKPERFISAVEIIDNTRFGLLKPVLVFAGILLLIILPVKAFSYYKAIDAVKGKVLGASESAMGDLIAAGQSAASFNFNQAGQGFDRAGSNFLSAQNELKEINNLLFTLASVVPDKNMRLAGASKNILKAGEASANAGKNLSLAIESLFNYKTNSTGDILENLSSYGHKAIADLTELTKALDQINSDVIPENYQKEFILLKQKTGELSRGLNEFIGLADSLS
ncbi:MAG: hypothetical protein WCL13_03180, partial [bacterium]